MKKTVVLPYSDRAVLMAVAIPGLRRKGKANNKENLFDEVREMGSEAHRHSYTPNPQLGKNASPRFTKEFYKTILPSLYDPRGFIKSHCRSNEEARQCEYAVRGAVSNIARFFAEKALDIRVKRKGAQAHNQKWDKTSVQMASQREKVKILKDDPPEIKELKETHNRNVEIINYRMMFIAAYVAAVLNKLLSANKDDIDRILRDLDVFSMDPAVLSKPKNREVFSRQVFNTFNAFFSDFETFTDFFYLGDEIRGSKVTPPAYRRARTAKTKQLKASTKKLKK